MERIITPYDVTEQAQAKRFVAMNLAGVGCESDVREEVGKMLTEGTHTVLITKEQKARLEVY